MNDGSLPVALDLLRAAHTDPVRSHQIHLYIILSLHNRWFPRFAYQWPGWPGNWWPDWWEPTEMPPRRWMLFSSCCGAYCWWTEKKGRVWSSIRLSSTGVAATKRGHYWNTCGRRWSTGRCAAICRRGTVSLPVCPNWCASVNASSRPPSSLGLRRFRGTISFSQRPLLPARTKPSNWPTLSSYKTRSPRWNLAVGFSCIAWHGNIPNTPWLFFFLSSPHRMDPTGKEAVVHGSSALTVKTRDTKKPQVGPGKRLLMSLIIYFFHTRCSLF